MKKRMKAPQWMMRTYASLQRKGRNIFLSRSKMNKGRNFSRPRSKKDGNKNNNEVTCYECKKPSHICQNCPLKRKKYKKKKLKNKVLTTI